MTAILTDDEFLGTSTPKAGLLTDQEFLGGAPAPAVDQFGQPMEDRPAPPDMAAPETPTNTPLIEQPEITDQNRTGADVRAVKTIGRQLVQPAVEAVATHTSGGKDSIEQSMATDIKPEPEKDANAAIAVRELVNTAKTLRPGKWAGIGRVVDIAPGGQILEDVVAKADGQQTFNEALAQAAQEVHAAPIDSEAVGRMLAYAAKLPKEDQDNAIQAIRKLPAYQQAMSDKLSKLSPTYGWLNKNTETAPAVTTEEKLTDIGAGLAAFVAANKLAQGAGLKNPILSMEAATQYTSSGQAKPGEGAAIGAAYEIPTAIASKLPGPVWMKAIAAGIGGYLAGYGTTKATGGDETTAQIMGLLGAGMSPMALKPAIKKARPDLPDAVIDAAINQPKEVFDAVQAKIEAAEKAVEAPQATPAKVEPEPQTRQEAPQAPISEPAPQAKEPPIASQTPAQPVQYATWQDAARAIDNDIVKMPVSKAMEALDAAEARLKGSDVPEEAKHLLEKAQRIRVGLEKDAKLKKIAGDKGRNFFDVNGWLADDFGDTGWGHVAQGSVLVKVAVDGDGYLDPKYNVDGQGIFVNRGPGQAARIRLQHGAGQAPLVFSDGALAQLGIEPRKGAEAVIDTRLPLKALTIEAKGRAIDVILNELDYQGRKVTDGVVSAIARNLDVPEKMVRDRIAPKFQQARVAAQPAGATVEAVKTESPKVAALKEALPHADTPAKASAIAEAIVKEQESSGRISNVKPTEGAGRTTPPEETPQAASGKAEKSDEAITLYHAGPSGIATFRPNTYFGTSRDDVASHTDAEQVYEVRARLKNTLVLPQGIIPQEQLDRAGVKYHLAEDTSIDLIGYNDELVKAIKDAGYDSVRTPDDGPYIPQVLVFSPQDSIPAARPQSPGKSAPTAPPEKPVTVEATPEPAPALPRGKRKLRDVVAERKPAESSPERTTTYNSLLTESLTPSIQAHLRDRATEKPSGVYRPDWLSDVTDYWMVQRAVDSAKTMSEEDFMAAARHDRRKDMAMGNAARLIRSVAKSSVKDAKAAAESVAPTRFTRQHYSNTRGEPTAGVSVTTSMVPKDDVYRAAWRLANKGGKAELLTPEPATPAKPATPTKGRAAIQREAETRLGAEQAGHVMAALDTNLRVLAEKSGSTADALWDKLNIGEGKGGLNQAEGPRFDADEVPTPVLNRMNQILKRMGYDSRGADDVREHLRQFTERTGRLTLPDWQAAYQEATGDVEYRKRNRENAKAEKARFTQVNWQRLKELGTTDNWREAGYINPKGGLVDLSGKREGGSPGMRNYDHREAGGTVGMQEAQAAGYIRFMPETAGFDMARKPTPEQVTVIRRIVKEKNGDVVVDLWNGLGPKKADGEDFYYLKPRERFYKEYVRGTSPDTIISDILDFYENPTAYREELAQPYRAAISILNGEAFLNFKGKADLTSFFHETFHAFDLLGLLPKEWKDTLDGAYSVADWSEARLRNYAAKIGIEGAKAAPGPKNIMPRVRKIEDLRWEVTRERQALAWEEYHRTGRLAADTPAGVKAIFAKLSAAFRQIYSNVKRLIELPPEVRSIFDQMYGSKRTFADTVNKGRAAKQLKDISERIIKTWESDSGLSREEGRRGSDTQDMNIDTRFAGKMPGELLDIPFNLRRFIKTNVPGGMAEDSLDRVGADAYRKALERLAAGKRGDVDYGIEQARKWAEMTQDPKLQAMLKAHDELKGADWPIENLETYLKEQEAEIAAGMEGPAEAPQEVVAEPEPALAQGETDLFGKPVVRPISGKVKSLGLDPGEVKPAAVGEVKIKPELAHEVARIATLLDERARIAQKIEENKATDADRARLAEIERATGADMTTTPEDILLHIKKVGKAGADALFENPGNALAEVSEAWTRATKGSSLFETSEDPMTLFQSLPPKGQLPLPLGEADAKDLSYMLWKSFGREEGRQRVRNMPLKGQTLAEAMLYAKGRLDENATMKDLTRIANQLPTEERAKALRNIASVPPGEAGRAKFIERVNRLMAEHEHRQAYRQWQAAVKSARAADLFKEEAAKLDAILEGKEAPKLNEIHRRTLEATRDYMQRAKAEGREVVMPDYVLEDLRRLERKAARDMTADDLRKEAMAINMVVHQHNTMNKLLATQIARTIQEAVNTIPREQEAEAPRERKSVSAAGEESDYRAGLVKQALNEGLTDPDRLAASHGEMFHALVHDEPRIGRTMAKGERFKFADALEAATVKAGAKWGSREVLKRSRYVTEAANGAISRLAGKLTRGQVMWIKPEVFTHHLESGQDVKLTSGNRITLVLTSRDPGAWAKFKRSGFHMEGWETGPTFKVTDADLRDIEASLTPLERAHAEAIWESFNGERRENLDKMARVLWGGPLTKDGPYYPTRVGGLDRQHHVSELLNIFVTKTLENFGWTKTRVEHNNPMLLGDAYETGYRQADEAGQFLHMAIPLRNARMVLGNPDIAKDITARYGKQRLRAWNQYLDDLVGVDAPTSAGQALLQWIRGNFATAKLSLRLSTALKQETSIPALAMEFDVKDVAAGMKNAVDLHGEGYQWVKKYSPEIRDRYEGNPAALATTIFGHHTAMLGYERLLNKAARIPIIGYQREDLRACLVAVGAARSELARTRPELKGEELENAIARRAEQAIRRTNNAADLADMPSFYRQGRMQPLVSILTMFGSDSNKKYNAIKQAVLDLSKGRNIAKSVKTLGIAGVLIPVMTAAITTAFRQLRGGPGQEDKESWAKFAFDSLTQLAADIPGGDQVLRELKVLFTGKGQQFTDTNQFTEATVKTLRGAKEAIHANDAKSQSAKDHQFWKGMSDMTDGLMVGLGIPQAPKEYATGIYRWYTGTGPNVQKPKASGSSTHSSAKTSAKTSSRVSSPGK